MSWGRTETQQQESSDMRAKKGGSKEGEQRGGQARNASEKGSVKDEKERAEAVKSRRGDKEKQM